MVFDPCESKPEVCGSGLLSFLSTNPILFSPDLGIDSPVDRSPNFIEGIHADSIPPTSNSHENATLLHNHNGLEGYPADQGVRHGGRGSNERYDVQSLGMTYEQVMGW
jgi:hypothetical protein